MNDNERLKKIIGNDDPFWYVTLNKFIEETYENKELGMEDLEKLAKNKNKFNDFTKQLLEQKDNLQSVKEKFLSFNELNIVISSRIYNGNYRKGSKFASIDSLKLIDKNATISSLIKFCIDEKINDNAKLEISIPFTMDEEHISKLDEIIKQITSNNDYLYNETHYSKKHFDPKKYSYTDININGIDYEVKSDDKILSDLRTIMNTELAHQAISKAYDSLIK